MPTFWPRISPKTLLLGLLVFGVAAGLRLYRLGDIPHGFYWDEAAITYNGWGLAVWNRDEFGNKLPVSFKSFGDYKAPLLIYVMGAIYKVTGLHPEYLRLVVSLSGIGAVALMYFLAKAYERQQLFPKSSSIIAAFLVAVTPWAVNFSRIGVEAMVALGLFLLAVLALEKAKQHPGYFFVASLAFGLSMYAYHSAKLVVPLYLLLWGLKERHLVMKSKLPVLLATLIGIGILYPLLRDTVVGSGFERGKSLIFFSHNLNLLPQNVLSFLNLNFWVWGHDAIGLRHGVPGFGVLLKSIFVLMLVGLFAVLKQKRHRFFLAWLMIGLLPSVLSTDAPHAIRSLLALPPAILLAVEGYVFLSGIVKKLALVLVSVETCFYVAAYYGPYAAASATSFQYGYDQAIQAAEKAGQHGDYKFVMTDYYGQPYIYTLLYRRITPEEFKFGALANYEFHAITWPDPTPNRIYIATPEEIPPTDPAVVETITIPGTQQPVFVIAKE